jgi:hypothetical protein
MEKIITYVAFDGTQFDDEDECVEYEFLENAKEYTDGFTLYNEAREPIKVSFNADALDKICFIIIKEARVIPFLDDWMADNYFYETIGKVANRLNIESCIGLWLWDYKEETWKHWETEMAKMRELGEYFQRFEE